jgi:hypothetical protein
MSETLLDTRPEKSAAAESAGYWALFVTQTAALCVVGAYGIPAYRLLFIGPGAGVPDSSFLPLLLAASLMQICYWSRRRLLPLPSVRRDDLSGHLLLFLARSLFVCACSFVPVALARLGEVTPCPLAAIAGPAALFAVFCYAWELERLARARLEPFAD